MLVVEDDDDSRDVIVFALTLAGARLLSARSAAGALEIMTSVMPDVLVVDLSMPGKDGYDLIQTVRSSSSLKHVPAIAITGLWEPDIEERTARAGFHRLMIKPVLADDLCSAVAVLRLPTEE